MTVEEVTLPEITTESVDAVFALLSRMEVHLDPNPLEFGPQRLNGKIAGARGLLTECEGVFLKVSHWLQKYRAAIRTQGVELEIGKKHLLANDPEVRSGRNVADRDALATMKLRDQVRAFSVMEQTQSDLEAMLTVIKAKRSDLKDVQGRIRDQIKLCQEEIGLGGRWGKVKPRPLPDLDASPNPEKKTLNDLHKMFQGTDTQDPKAPAVGVSVPSTETPDVFVTQDDEADEFLNAIVPPIQATSALTPIEDLLDGLDL
jgi:hypothetical protein